MVPFFADVDFMRYHYTPGRIDSSIYAKIYICNHLVYSKCTLYQNKNVGLAVIQQRYDTRRKYTLWGSN